ncbi:MAG: hypothetical protein C3F02_00745 [Parcubacteria group bacterium]|nr:MAG: hypothetical protein C3F02_00745 [Parcubacteria group bacterium]
MPSIKLKYRYFICAIIWAVLIFYLSSIPDLKSSLPSLYDLISRKLAHISEYAVLSYLIARGLNSRKNEAVAGAVVLAIAYSLSDEQHQVYVPGRKGSPIDIFIDAIGVYLGMVIFLKQAPLSLKSKIKKTAHRLRSGQIF